MPYFYIRSSFVGRLIGPNGRNINLLRYSHDIGIRAPRHVLENIEKLSSDPSNWTSIWAEEITDRLVRDIEELVGFHNIRESCPHLHHLPESHRPVTFFADALRIEDLEQQLVKHELQVSRLQAENNRLRSLLGTQQSPIVIDDDESSEEEEIREGRVKEKKPLHIKSDRTVAIKYEIFDVDEYDREIRQMSVASQLRYNNEEMKKEMDDEMAGLYDEEHVNRMMELDLYEMESMYDV